MSLPKQYQDLRTLVQNYVILSDSEEPQTLELALRCVSPKYVKWLD